MPTSPILAITQVSASQSQKEVTINNAIDALEAAQNATLTCDYAGAAADKILSATQFTRNFIFKCTNANGAAKLVVPQTLSGLPTTRVFAVRNECGYPITVTTNAVGANTVLVPDLATRLIYTGGIHSIVAAEAASTSNFKDMLDVPNSYVGQAGKHVRVKLDETGIDFDLPNLADCSDIDFSVAPVNGSRLAYDTASSKWKPVAYTAPTTTFLGLTDVPDSYAGHAAKFIRVNAGETGVEFVSTGVFSDTLTDLVDFPSSYTGAALKALRVNAAGTGVEFYIPTLVTAFANLTDVPASYTGHAGKMVRVKSTEDGLEYVTALNANSLDDFPDHPGAYTGNELKSVRVNAAGTALEYYTSAGGITTFTGLSDAPASYTGHAGKHVRVKGTEDGLEFYTPAATISTFLGLTDVPDSYTGHANKFVKVKADESGVEFVAGGGGGASALDDLSDVTITTVADNQVLVYDNASSQWKNRSRPYRVPWFFTTSPISSEVLLIHIFTTAVAFPANFAGTLGHCETPPAAGFAIDVVKVTAAGASSSVGTITIANGTGVVTFTSASGAAVNFAAGDRMKLVASATAGTAANATGTFEGTY